MSEDTRKIEFWSCDLHAEHLIHESIGEAVEDEWDTRTGRLPEMVEVYGFAYMELPQPEHIASNVLERLLEDLDGEYGNPEEGYWRTKDVDPALKEAALTFANAVRKHYKPWACERVETRTVRVSDYIEPEPAA